MNIEEYLRGLLDRMGFDNYGIEYDDDGQYITMKISLPEAESGIIIGTHGETLTAIRRLIRAVYLEELGDRRLAITVNDYRDQREQKIRQLIDRGINKIRHTHRPYKLYRLNAADRFFAHNLIASERRYQGYTTHSIDDPEDGRVLILETKRNGGRRN